MVNSQTSTLKELLVTAGINQIIWIDDLFAKPDDEKLIIRIKEKLAKLEVYNLKPIHKVFNSINFDAPTKIRDEQIDKVLYDNAEILYEIYDSIIQQLKDLKPSVSEPDEDLTPNQVEALLKALENVKEFSYRNWQSENKDFLRKCSENTLILVDREFVNEGASPNAGDEILSMVIEHASTSYCILLTHTVPPEETENLRRQIADDPKNNIKIHQFSVMSKRELGSIPQDAEPHLASSLRVALTHRFCFDLASESVYVMHDSLETAVNDLISLSIYNLDQSIFENSLNEGASELDVVNRILFLRQRIATKKHFASNPAMLEKLKRLRDIRELQKIVCPSEVDDVSKSKLHEWRISEVLEPAELVNKIHSPLKCGDLFVNTKTKIKFILLAQPCDIIVRANGKRYTEEAIFVRMVEKLEVRNIPERYFEIKGIGDNGEPWTFDFRKLAYVNLRVLDLAVLNNSGLVQITKDQEIPSALLPGWRKRLQALQNGLRPRKKPLHIRFLSLSQNFPDNECKVENNNWKFTFQRIGRIRSPYSETMLGSLAAFQTRAAFDHDFTKTLTETETPSE